jgi:hypothetical protein
MFPLSSLLHFYGFQAAGGRTWLRHLRAGDYSEWLRDKIKDGELADDVASAEKDEALTPSESRRRIKEAIERRYTNPA